MQIQKCIYLVCGFPYGVHANVHAVRTNDGIVFFDCGTNRTEADIISENLAYWGLDGLPVTHVFVTHVHQDHSGNCKYYRDMGAKIIAGPGDCDAIENGDLRTIDYALCERFEVCPVDIKAVDGDVIEAGGLKVECIHIPGHTEGSMIFKVVIDGKIIVFTGDSIRVGANAQSAILGWTGGPDYDREQYIDSLGKVARLQCDILCGGHFQPMIGNAWKVMGWAYKTACEDLRPCKNLV